MPRKLFVLLALVAGLALGASVRAKDLADAVSESAMSEWVMAGVRDSTTTYFDRSTISKADNMVKMWKLIDYETSPPQNFTKPYRSHKEHAEFDCEKGQARHLALVFYAGNMGKGEAVYTENIAGTWTSYPTGTTDDALLKLACGKR
jgi:hypothetical protein